MLSSALVACGDGGGEGDAPCDTQAYRSERGECVPITQCTESEYVAVHATELTDAVCAPLTICRDGEEETTAPTPLTDRVCTACGADRFESDGVCVALTECTSTEFESVAPTTTSDRVCSALTDCADGEEQSVPPTETTDRVCSACGLGRYGVEGACFDLTVCGEAEYESVPPTSTTDRVCTTVTDCEAGEFESAAPTGTSDRECTPYTVCVPGEMLITEGTPTSDYVCEACEGGYSETENAASCTPWTVDCAAGEVESVGAGPTHDRACTTFEQASTWVTQTESTTDEVSGEDIAVGRDGRVALVGEMQSGSTPSSPAFVVVYDDERDELWRDVFGGIGINYATTVAIDDDGNVIVAGYLLHAYVEGEPSNEDAYVRKYDESGQILWTRELDASMSDRIRGVAVDHDGNVFVVGSTLGAFPGQTNAEGADMFVRTYDAAGAEIWTVQLGPDFGKGAGGYDVTVNSEGHAIVLAGVEFDGVFRSLPSPGGDDVVVLELDGNGAVVWARRVGTGGHDYPGRVAVDDEDDVIFTWSRQGSETMTAYVQKLDALGADVWTSEITTAAVITVAGVAVDEDGDIVAVGMTSAAFPGYPSVGGPYDLYARKLDADGRVLWTRMFGSSAFDIAMGVAFDLEGNALMTGTTRGALPGQILGSSTAQAFIVGLTP